MIKGEDPVLLNQTYIRPTKQNDFKEYFEVIYKTKDGTVHKSEEPGEADIYIVKPEYRTCTYNKPQERIEKMDKVRVPISKIRYAIAEAMGDDGKKFIESCYKQGNYNKLNQLYKWPYCFGCDFQPEYYYMKNWYEKHPFKGVPKLTKAYLDIETDLMDYTLDMDNIPGTAYSPVNLVSVINEDTNEVVTFILRPYKPSRLGRSEEEYQKRYKMYEKQLKDHEYLMSHKDEFYKDLHESFDSTYGRLNYHIRDYEQEIDLIADVFAFINSRKPNFCLIWNMRFDIQYLYYRIIALGYDPKTIMCHKDFDTRKSGNDIDQRRCSFKVDKSTFLIEKQYDYFYCSSYTQYICQMRLYSSTRKSQHKLQSVALNAIADRVLKDKKVEYPEQSNIVRFAYVNWILFVKYNIKDVLLQKGIENKTQDIKGYYRRSHSNLTPYNKVFRETHLLRNVREIYFEQEGWVQSNNLNIIDMNEDDIERRFYHGDDEEEEESTFKGAINADPIWNARVGMKVMGSRTNNVFSNSVDFDMSAFYPSSKIASNMDPATLLYKASFINDEFISGEFINRSLNTKYVEKDKNGNMRRLDFTGEAVNTFVSGNMLSFGYNFLGLPNITSLYNRVLRELQVS